MTDSAVVDGAAAAKAAAAKITYHRDNILAANPDNRFAPFAVEEGKKPDFRTLESSCRSARKHTESPLKNPKVEL